MQIDWWIENWRQKNVCSNKSSPSQQAWWPQDSGIVLSIKTGSVQGSAVSTCTVLKQDTICIGSADWVLGDSTTRRVLVFRKRHLKATGSYLSTYNWDVIKYYVNVNATDAEASIIKNGEGLLQYAHQVNGDIPMQRKWLSCGGKTVVVRGSKLELVTMWW